jgi:hypothetical protein
VIRAELPLSRAHLWHLIRYGNIHGSGLFVMTNCLPSPAPVFALSAVRDLRVEIETIEAWYGPNAYSNYLRKHGRRPNPAEAAGMGRLLGGQVEADDGSMQPPLSAADRSTLKGIKTRRKAYARRYDHIMRLKTAIAALAENEDDPADVIGDGSCVLGESEIDAQLDIAVCWLNRFAEYWHGRKKEARAPGSQPLGRDQKQSSP